MSSTNLGLSFGVNTLTYGFKVDKKMLEALEPLFLAHGVTALEVPFPALALENPVKEIKAFMGKTGVTEISICHFYAGDAPNPLSPEQEQAALKSLEDACSFAKHVDAKKVAGPLGILIGDEGGTVDQVVAYMKKAVPLAEKFGVTLCVEPLREEEDLVLGLKNAVQAAKEVGSERFQIHYDTFHGFCFEGDPASQILDIDDKLGHIHISGSKRLTPGLDEVDWKSVRDGLRSVHYRGAVVLELFGPGCRDEISGIVDEDFPRSLSTAASIEVTRFTLERHGIIAPIEK